MLPTIEVPAPIEQMVVSGRAGAPGEGAGSVGRGAGGGAAVTAGFTGAGVGVAGAGSGLPLKLLSMGSPPRSVSGFVSRFRDSVAIAVTPRRRAAARAFRQGLVMPPA